MPDPPPLEPGEVLLRRLLPRGKRRAEYGKPVKGREMRPRRKPENWERGLSCSRLRLTSPADLIARLPPSIDASRCAVCALRSERVLAVADRSGPSGSFLRIEVDPTDDDPGHVVIVVGDGRPCPDSQETRDELAALARVLSEEEVAGLRAGGPPPGDLP